MATYILITDDAFADQLVHALLMGRQRLPVRVVDASTLTATWAAVLAAGAVSGGTSPEISTGDALRWADATRVANTGNMRIGTAWTAYASTATADVQLIDWDGTNLTIANGVVPVILDGASVQMRTGGFTRFRVNSTEVVMSVSSFSWNATLVPMISQVAATAGNPGSDMTMQAQSGAPGGDLALVGGDDSGATQGGNAYLRGGASATGTAGQAYMQHADGYIAIRVQGAPGAAWAGNQAINVGTGGLAFFDGTTAVKPSVTGSKAANAALASLCTTLANMGLITDNTT